MISADTVARFEQPLALDNGAVLPRFDIAYTTYGQMAADRANAILICHGLTSDHYAAGVAPYGRAGWWDAAIGPGKLFDTDRYCVVSTNALGSFGGTTGPASPDPENGGKPYGMRFPLISIGDMANATTHLADRLGIARFHAVVGGCMGGFQALEWMARHPHRLARAVIISATPRTSAHNLALWHILRQAIRLDPNWQGGDYYDGEAPLSGLALASMMGALFWISRETLEAKFGLTRIPSGDAGPTHDEAFAVEQFLNAIAANAPRRLDANALIVLTRAIDYFDLGYGRTSPAEAFGPDTPPALFVSYDNDWRYPPPEIEAFRAMLAERGVSAIHRILSSPLGHGAFLRDIAPLAEIVGPFLG